MIKRALRRIRATFFHRKMKSLSRADRFASIYRSNWWSGSPESRSGTGSSLANTSDLRTALPEFLKAREAKVFLDAPCGDFHWMRQVDLPDGVHYIGADIVAELISDLQAADSGPNTEFRVLDIVEDPLPAADVMMCRDCLFHLSEADIFNFLHSFAEGQTPVLLTTYMPSVTANKDIQTGLYRPLNLTLAPFNLPVPQTTMRDYVPPRLEKYLAVWSREEVVAALQS